MFIIGVILINDDSKMRAMINNPSIGTRGQSLKSSEEKIDEEITVPYFLAYPSHILKVVAKHTL